MFRFLSLLIPLTFLYLGYKFNDTFYFILAVGGLIFSLLVSLPSILSNKRLSASFLRSRKLRQDFNNVIEVEEEIVNLEKRFIINFRKNLLILVLLVIALTLFSVYKLDQVGTSQNIILNYYSSLLLSLKNNFLFLALLPILFFFMQKLSKFKKINITKQLLTFAFITLVSFLISFLTTYSFSVLEANYYGFKKSTQNSGILSEPKEIAEAIKKTNTAPKVVGVGNNYKKSFIAIEYTNKNRGKFYTEKIISWIPEKFLITLNPPDKSIVLYGNYLLIRDLDKEAIQTISPVLGKALVKGYFESSVLKDEPDLKVVSRQEYLKLRDDQINKQLGELDDALKEVNNYLGYLYGVIQEAKGKIEVNQSGVGRAIAARDDQYNYCKTAGYYSYYFGTFYRYYTDGECESKRQEWDQIIAGFQQNISDWQASLSQAQTELPEFQYYKQRLESVRVLVESQKQSAIQELGLFEPEKSIKVVLESTDNKAINDYLGTLIHEYIHYTSYVSDERTLPRFFEEGLTEYFARKTMSKELGQNTNLGYPLIVKIIEEIMKKVPEDEFKRIYFTKNEEALKSVLNKAYGNKFYAQSELYFTILIFDFSSPESLKIANNIMFKVGGKELKEEDLSSSVSQ